MRHVVEVSATAAADLDRLEAYVTGTSGPARARALVDGILRYCRGFDLFPERGIARDDIRPGLRLVGFRRQATIAFTVVGGRVVILRVLYAGRPVEDDLGAP